LVVEEAHLGQQLQAAVEILQFLVILPLLLVVEEVQLPEEVLDLVVDQEVVEVQMDQEDRGQIQAVVVLPHKLPQEEEQVTEIQVEMDGEFLAKVLEVEEVLVVQEEMQLVLSLQDLEV
jgi:hypothetical protein